VTVDMHQMVERCSRPIDPSLSDAEGWTLAASQLWATPDADLELLTKRFAAVETDPDQDAASRTLAGRLLDAVEVARAGEVPSIETMRAVSEAVTAICHPRRDSMKGW
jgi:hypothetical protein